MPAIRSITVFTKITLGSVNHSLRKLHRRDTTLTKMSVMARFLLVLIVASAGRSTAFFSDVLHTRMSVVVDGRALRQRRQLTSNQQGQGVANYVASGFNAVRDTVAPVIGSTVDRFSQYWDRYKPNMNQISQGWNQFTQSFSPQYSNYNNGYYPNNRKRSHSPTLLPPVSFWD